MTVCQKLGIILESKVVQKLSLEKKVFNKSWSPNDKYLTSKIDFESRILALFDKLSLLVGIF